MKKTNNIILAILISLWLMMGCGTIKSWFSDEDEKVDNGLTMPLPSEVSKNPDGTWNFTKEQLTPKEKTDWLKWGLLSGFLVSTGFVVRHVVKNRLK